MLDLEKDTDPDLDDLREEFRPQFKSRFEGWLGLTFTVGKPAPIFRAVYNELLAMMPFLRDSEVVDEMLSRYVSFFALLGVLPSYQSPSHGVTKDFGQSEQAPHLRRTWNASFICEKGDFQRTYPAGEAQAQGGEN